MASALPLQEFRELARQTSGIDLEAYARYDKDPLLPILWPVPCAARVGIFGRDPGRDEIQHGEPFIGAGGQIVRRVLHQHLHGRPPPDFAAARAVGRHLFWANTVPYKPLGNKAWSMQVKQRFQPLVSRLLLEGWQGEQLITLGREAFLWFGIGQARAERERLEAFWGSEPRFAQSIDVLLRRDGVERRLQLHPLPHPSPLNATWYRRFPELLAARLQQLQLPRAP
jgi:uracil-DNA glycosylase